MAIVSAPNLEEGIQTNLPVMGPTPTSKFDRGKGLSKQYGGIHAHSWVECLPLSWHPYVQLARLSPPAALFLIYFPHLFGVLHAAHRLDEVSGSNILRVAMILFGGSFFFSNAAHAWNDLIDSPIDGQVARSKNRPIPRGAISPKAAFFFAASQALGALAFLPCLGSRTAIATIPTIIGTTYYPWAKLHTHFPQVVLGVCLAWGIVVGSAAAGLERAWMDLGTLTLVLASVIWTVIYDTIYAYQDIEDDKVVGVKSIAVLVRTPEQAKVLLWSLWLLMGVPLVSYARLEGMGTEFYIVAIAGSMASLGTMIGNVQLRSVGSCWLWFSVGFWYVGVCISAGLLSQFVSLRDAFAWD